MKFVAKNYPSLLFFLFAVLAFGRAHAGPGSVLVQVESGKVKPGESVCLEVAGSRMSQVVAMQFSLVWDPQVLEFSEVKDFGLPNLSQENFGDAFIEEGALTFVYLAPAGQELAGELSFFTLCFTAVGSAGASSPVSFSDRPTGIEFVADIDNVADLLDNYTLLGGSVAILADPAAFVPFAVRPGGELQMNCLIGGSVGLSVRGEGGTPPYSFSWEDPGGQVSARESLTARSPGEYRFRASDAAGHVVRGFFNVIASDLKVDDVAVESASCEEVADGSASVSATGGVGALVYSWTGGEKASGMEDLSAGTYTVTVSDVMGCAIVETVEVGAGPGVTLDPEVTEPSCGRSDGAIRLQAASPDGGLRYDWSNGASGGQVTGLAPGIYSVEVFDVKGCVARDTFDLSWIPLSVDVSVNCTVTEGEVTEYGARARALGGDGPYEFAWSTGDTESGVEISEVILPGPGLYGLTVTDAEGCVVTTAVEVEECVPQFLVWPGDADNSGLVDHFDLLNMGLGYGQTGPRREGSSLAWKAQEASPWLEGTPVSGANYLYADADGNGRVEAADTMAIAVNWGREATTDGVVPPASPRSADAHLLVEPSVVAPGQAASFNILLGDSGQALEDAYGLAFSIVYDDQAIIAGTVTALFEGSWLGDPVSELLTFQRNDEAAHRIDVAITRVDHLGVDGSGSIGRLALRIAEEIPGGKATYDLIFRVENARLIGPEEQILGVTPMETISTLEATSGVNDPVLLREISLYPNPAPGVVKLDTGNLHVEGVALLHAAGGVLQSWEKGGELRLDGAAAAGTYILRVISREGIANLPLVILR